MEGKRACVGDSGGEERVEDTLNFYIGCKGEREEKRWMYRQGKVYNYSEYFPSSLKTYGQ